MSQHLMKIGEVAAQAGVSTRTVDYYTNLGLISPVARTDGSFRLYDPAAIDRIATIRHLEGLGVSLDDLTSTLAAPTAPDLATLLNRLDQDLHTLQSTTDTTAGGAHDLLVTAITRAHNLITAAIDIAATLPPGG